MKQRRSDNRVNKLVIIGAGGLGKEVLEIVRSTRNSAYVTGFLDDDRMLQGKEIAHGVRVVGYTRHASDVMDGTEYIIALGSNKARQMIANRSRVRFATAIHHSAIVPGYLTATDLIIGAGAVITESSVKIGNHVHIDAGCVVSHDVVLSNFVRLNPGVLVMGGCVIGEGALIAAGAVIRDRVKVGPWATVGMGSVVLEDVPAGATVFGVPARRAGS